MKFNIEKTTFFFTSGIILTLLFCTGIVALIFNLLNNNNKYLKDSLKLNEAKNKILYYDEILTMSARIATFKGDKVWEERYLKYLEKLNTNIDFISKHAPNSLAGEDAAQTDQANNHLISIEKEAFKLIKENKLEMAQNILFSASYLKQKEIYQNSMIHFEETIDRRLKTLEYILVVKNRRTIVSSSVLFILLLLTWLFIFMKLREITIRIKRSDNAKSDFLATMSHELRTPMNAIIGFSTICESENDIIVTKKNASFIKQSGIELLTLINDLLDYSSIEKRNLKLSFKETSIEKIIQTTIRNAQSSLNNKSVIITSYISEDTPSYVLIDPIRVKQILLNLVSNAIKFTPRGTISILVSAKKINRNRFEYYFQVQDTGIGIPKADQEYLFERFTQIESSLSRRFKGTGLGLAISRHLCELMGGELWLDSTEGEGSNFQFSLPFQILPHPPGEENQDTVDFIIPKNINVLVAEDNAVNRALAQQLFTKIGITIDIAVDGLKAVEMAQETAYDYIFMDMQMPLLCGIEATEKIIENNKFESLPKIIALTANVFEKDKEECARVGMIDFIEKPLLPDTIKNIFIKHQH